MAQGIKYYLLITLYVVSSFFILACIFIGLYAYFIIIEDENYQAWGPDPICRNDKVKFAHRYHGILMSEYDDKAREWVFYRDGQRCSLYRSIPKDAWDGYYNKK